MPPSRRLIRPGLPRKPTPQINSDKLISATKGRSRCINSGSTLPGAIRPAIPTTPKVLKRLEPKTLPKARACCPFLAAANEAASSGTEVPKAKMVKPMSKSLTPSARAICSAPQIRPCELSIMATKLSTKTTQVLRMLGRWASATFSASSVNVSVPSTLAMTCDWRPEAISQAMSVNSKPTNTTASIRLNTPSNSSHMLINVTPQSMGNSLRKILDSNGMGLISAVKPRMSPMLAMLEP